MFTTGIFSTHLPYIAFLFFYAFFFFFNTKINQPEKAEKAVPESKVTYLYENISQNSNNTYKHNIQTNSAVSLQSCNRIFSVIKPAKTNRAFVCPLIKDIFFFVYFSRPPPFR